MSYPLCDEVWCLLVRGCVVESDDDFAGGGRDGGGELLEQACREVRWALAAAEEDDARGHVSIPVDGAVIEGCDQTDEKNRRGRAAGAMNELEELDD